MASLSSLLECADETDEESPRQKSSSPDLELSLDATASQQAQMALQEIKEECYEMNVQQEALTEKYEKAKQMAYIQHFELQTLFQTMFTKYMSNMNTSYEGKISILEERRKQCETAYKAVSQTPRSRMASLDMRTFDFSQINSITDTTTVKKIDTSFLSETDDISEIENFEFHKLNLTNVIKELKNINNNLILDGAWDLNDSLVIDSNNSNKNDENSENCEKNNNNNNNNVSINKSNNSSNDKFVNKPHLSLNDSNNSVVYVSYSTDTYDTNDNNNIEMTDTASDVNEVDLDSIEINYNKSKNAKRKKKVKSNRNDGSDDRNDQKFTEKTEKNERNETKQGPKSSKRPKGSKRPKSSRQSQSNNKNGKKRGKNSTKSAKNSRNNNNDNNVYKRDIFSDTGSKLNVVTIKKYEKDVKKMKGMKYSYDKRDSRRNSLLTQSTTGAAFEHTLSGAEDEINRESKHYSSVRSIWEEMAKQEKAKKKKIMTRRPRSQTMA